MSRTGTFKIFRRSRGLCFGPVDHIMGRLIYMALLMFLVLAAGCGPRHVRPHGSEAITLAVAGDTGLSASLYRTESHGGAAHPPGLVLIHRPGGDRAVWRPFATWLQQRGYLVVVPDFRPKELVPTAPHASAESVRPWDEVFPALRAAKQALLDAGADPANLAVAGEGAGAGFAFEYALRDRDMQGVIALSPEAGVAGFKAREQVKRLGDCPLLLMVSEADPHGAALARALRQAASGFCELRTFTVAGYGADLLTNSANARAQALLWMKTVLTGASGADQDGKKAPPVPR